MRPIKIYCALVLMTSLLFSIGALFIPNEFIQVSFMVSPAMLALCVSFFDKQRPWLALGWQPNFRYWPHIIFHLAAVIVVLLLVSYGMGHLNFNKKSFEKFFELTTLTSLIVGVLLNTGEEAGWRGYLFPSLLREKGWWPAIFWTTLIWWLWHLPFMAVLQWQRLGYIHWLAQIIQLISLLPVSVIFGIWMTKSESFWVIGFAHQLINFMNKWFLGLEHSSKTPLFFKDRDFIFLYSTENGILGILAMVALATLLYKKYGEKFNS